MDLELPPEARALLDAMVAIGSDLDLRGVLARIVEASCRLTDAEYGVLGIVDDEGAFIDLVPSDRAATQLQEIGRMPEGTGLPGLVTRERRSIRVAHVAAHPASTGSFPDNHPVIDSFLGAPVLVGEQAFGHLYLGNKRGGVPFTPTDQALVEALARAAGVMIDHARSYEQTEWRRHWLDVTTTITTTQSRHLSSGSRRMQLMLDELVAALRDLFGATVTALALISDEGVLEIRHQSGDPDAVTEVIDRLADTIRQTVTDQVPVRLPIERGRVTLIAPATTRLVGRGVLVVEGATETPSLQGILLDAAAVSAEQMALIVDRYHALRDRATLLVAKDRDRIARDLHDLVIQRLFATGMQLQAARGLEPGELRERVDAAVSELDATIKELRSTIFELSADSQTSLLNEVRALIGEYADVLGFRPVLRSSGPVDRALGPAAAAQVLGTLREAISNIARHARASSATIEVNAGSAWFSLRVSDDGVGFDPATARVGGGSVNLRSRAEELGGHLAVTSAPGAGTTLEWVIPAASH